MAAAPLPFPPDTNVSPSTAPSLSHSTALGGAVGSVRRYFRGWERAVGWFVWGVWAAMFGGALVFVASFGNTLPWGDDYLLLGGDNWSSVGWLWAQHCEHRVPLAKLLWVAVLVVTGFDFRAGIFLTVLALGAVAGAMIRTARRLRGRTSLVDAFFPLALFNFGQYHLYTWWWMINQTLAPLFACALLLLLARSARPRPRDAVLVGAVLVLLALGGPGGLPYALALALWLAAGAALDRTSEMRIRVLALTLAAAAAALVGAYFTGFSQEGSFGHSREPLAAIAGALQILSVSLGPGTNTHWPYWGASVALLCAISGAILVVAWRTQPAERWRVAGLGLFLGATVGLALIMGWARGGMDADYVLSGHYVTKALPALFCAYLIWELYGGRAAGFVQLGLFAAVGCLFLFNLGLGIQGATAMRDKCREMEDDLQAGITLFRMAGRHAFIPVGVSVEWSIPLFQSLQQQRIGSFGLLQPDSPRRTVPVPLMILATNDMPREDGAWEADGEDPHVILGLKEPRFVHGVQIRVRLPKMYYTPPLHFLLDWRNSSQNEFGLERRCTEKHWPAYGDTLTFGVFDTIDQVRLSFQERPRVFEVLEIKLLLAKDGIPRWAELARDGAAVLDDQCSGFVQTGDDWHLYEGPPPVYGGSLRFAFKGAGANMASWELGELAPGSYTVQATWTEGADRASNATYRLYDGATLAATIRADQRQTPSGLAVQGVRFQELTTIQVGSGRLLVAVDDAADGIVIADAVRVVPVP